MLKSSFCNYSDAYMAVKGTIKVPNTGTTAAQNNRNKEVVFKDCAPFTDCTCKINSTQIDNAKDIDVVMNMQNLIKYSESYSETTGSLCQYNRDEPALIDDSIIIDFPANHDTSLSFKYKKNISLEKQEIMTQKILKYGYH